MMGFLVAVVVAIVTFLMLGVGIFQHKLLMFIAGSFCLVGLAINVFFHKIGIVAEVSSVLVVILSMVAGAYMFVIQ